MTGPTTLPPATPLPDSLEQLRTSLPVTDPDRHTLDVPADDAFAHLAPGYQAVAR